MFRFLVVAALALIPALGQSNFPYYTITDLGVLPGMQSSTATGISSSGTVSGYSSPATTGAPGIVGQGFLYANGTMTAVQKSGDTFTVPIAVNASGAAVGLTGDYSSRRLTPFVYQNGQFQIPAGMPYDATGQSITLLTGINDAGTILGNTAPAHTSGGGTSPFILSNGTANYLPFAFATAIDQNGDVAGWSGNAAAQGDLAAVYWSGGSKTSIDASIFGCQPTPCIVPMQALAVTAGHAVAQQYDASFNPNSVCLFPAGECTGPQIATGINSSGFIAGMSAGQGSSTQAALGFANAGISGDMFSAGGVDLVGALFAWPFSTYFAPGLSYAPGLLAAYTPPRFCCGETLLSQLIVNGEGWNLNYVVGINDAGQIAGTGMHDGQQRAFLLTPGAAAPTGPSIFGVVGGGLSVPPVSSIATGGWFSIFGLDFQPTNDSTSVLNGFGGGVGLTPQEIANNTLPTNLGSTCVEVNGVRAALDFAGPGQVNAQAPAVGSTGNAQVTVISNCGNSTETTSAPMTVPVAASAPEFLYLQTNNNGQNPVAATFVPYNPNNSYLGLVGFRNGPGAKAGDQITIYAVGLGATTPPQIPGTIATASATVNGDATVTIGGVKASISYAGISPGSSGLYQINLTVPTNVPAGNQPVVVTVKGTSSPNGGYLAMSQ